MYEFDATKAFRLIDVRDHEGKSKADSKELYRERVGCIATGIRKSTYYSHDDVLILRMFFIQDAEGRWINRALRTSPVTEIREQGKTLEIHTENSIYVLEPAEMPEPEYRDEAELIELYLNDEDTRFCKGFYYDAEKKPHELSCHVHVGTFVDTCLIYLEEDEFMNDTACRYYLRYGSVEFYDTLYHQQDYSRRMLIHNTSKHPMEIKFEGFNAVWTILPGSEKLITPYCFDGSDERSATDEGL